MSQASEALASSIEQRFGDKVLGVTLEAGEVVVALEADALIEVAMALRDEPDFRFEQLMDVCGLDYLHYGEADWQTSESATSSGFSRGVSKGATNEATDLPSRYAIAYELQSITHNMRMRLKTWLRTEPPRVPSVVGIWSSADWAEREAFDLFGILFEGHPDLRRILTDYGFVGHPFRKDFPVSGHVEMRYDPERRRVVYQPVSIEPRTLVPRVIRHDHRFETGVVDESDAGEAADA